MVVLEKCFFRQAQEFCNLENDVLLKHTENNETIPRHIAFRMEPNYISTTEKVNSSKRDNFGFISKFLVKVLQMFTFNIIFVKYIF